MEDSSHELIDQMIAEEQYCYGFDAVPQITTVGAINGIQTQQHLPALNIGEVSITDNTKKSNDVVLESPIVTKPKKGKKSCLERLKKNRVTFFLTNFI